MDKAHEPSDSKPLVTPDAENSRIRNEATYTLRTKEGTLKYNYWPDSDFCGALTLQRCAGFTQDGLLSIQCGRTAIPVPSRKYEDGVFKEIYP
jgi:hypothetical protein